MKKLISLFLIIASFYSFSQTNEPVVIDLSNPSYIYDRSKNIYLFDTANFIHNGNTLQIIAGYNGGAVTLWQTTADTTYFVGLIKMDSLLIGLLHAGIISVDSLYAKIAKIDTLVSDTVYALATYILNLIADSLFITDTDMSNTLHLKWNENDNTDRTLNLILSSGDRTFTLSGNLDVESSSKVNQDLTTDADVIHKTIEIDTAFADVYTNKSDMVLSQSGSDVNINADTLDLPTANFQMGTHLFQNNALAVGTWGNNLTITPDRGSWGLSAILLADTILMFQIPDNKPEALGIYDYTGNKYMSFDTRSGSESVYCDRVSLVVRNSSDFASMCILKDDDWLEYFCFDNDLTGGNLEATRFYTATAIGTANYGRFQFHVDEIEILRINDSGLNLLANSITGTSVDINNAELQILSLVNQGLATTDTVIYLQIGDASNLFTAFMDSIKGNSPLWIYRDSIYFKRNIYVNDTILASVGNFTGAILYNGDNINTAGILTNIPYLSKLNTFGLTQTVTKSSASIYNFWLYYNSNLSENAGIYNSWRLKDAAGASRISRMELSKTDNASATFTTQFKWTIFSDSLEFTPYRANGDSTFIDSTLIVSDNVGIGITPSSTLHINGLVPGEAIGSHPAGQLIIQNPTDDVNACAIITGYESDGSGNPDQQLWYLGSFSASNENITFLNRRDANLSLGTSGTARLTISGDGSISTTGDFTVGGDFAADKYQSYGGMGFSDSAKVIELTNQNEWYQVTGLIASAHSNNVTMAGDSLDPVYAGDYEGIIHLCFKGETNGDIIEIALAIGEVIDDARGKKITMEITAQGKSKGCAFHGYYTISAGEAVTLWARNTANAGNDITVVNCRVHLTRK